MFYATLCFLEICGRGYDMELVIKHFSELTNIELYEILQVRVAVFVLEQNCAYQEVDGKDIDAIHVYLKDETGIQAYCRVLAAGVSYKEASIGRVLTLRRGSGLGEEILSASIQVARDSLNANSIRIGAQAYAKAFYEKLGFKQASSEYLEDYIPHIEMLLEL